MADKKKLVSEITSMDVDFAQWYTDIVKKAEMIDYSSLSQAMRDQLPGIFGRYLAAHFAPYLQIRMVTDEQRDMANGTDDASMSIGGMKSKLRCADILNSAGECLWIASGKDPHVIDKIFRAEDIGTVFLPRHRTKVESRKRWIA